MTEKQRYNLACNNAEVYLKNNLGKRYQNARFENSTPTLATEYIKKLTPGKLMIMHGDNGVGKTFSAACWIRQNIEENMFTRGYAPGIYITALKFERKYCQPGYWNTDTKRNWQDLLQSPWVVFDDLGTEDPNNLKFKTHFADFFETLHREKKTLIILTNVSIEENYDKRIVSRIRDWAIDGSVWEIQGEDLRYNKEIISNKS